MEPDWDKIASEGGLAEAILMAIFVVVTIISFIIIAAC